jgi:hypothetical protein
MHQNDIKIYKNNFNNKRYFLIKDISTASPNPNDAFVTT